MSQTNKIAPEALNRQLALLGAAERIRQLLLEADQIYGLFPELRRRPSVANMAIATRARRQGGGRSTPDRRRAVSEGMRRYWAKRKAQEKSTRKQ